MSIFINGIEIDEFKINTETLSGNKTLVLSDKIVQWLDPGGADRNVTMPAEAQSGDILFIILNTADGAGEDLLIYDDTPTLIATLGPGMSGIFSCNGTAWKWEDAVDYKYDKIAQSTIFPQVNDAATPTIAFGDGDSGIYEVSDDGLGISIAGVQKWTVTSLVLGDPSSTGAQILNETCSATNPNIVPAAGDPDTGIGRAAADALSLIAGGVEGWRITENTLITHQITGHLQGATYSNQQSNHAGFDLLGLMTAPKFLNLLCEDPSAGYCVNITPEGHLTSLGIAFVDSNPDTITDTGNLFVTNGFKVGNFIRVSGSTSNDRVYTIATVAAGTLTLDAGDALVAEAAGARVTIDVVGKYMGGGWTAGDRIHKGSGLAWDPNGTNNYISLGDSDGFSFGDGTNDSPVTWFGAIEVVDTAGVQTIISKDDETTGAELKEWAVLLGSDEVLALYMFDESVNVYCRRYTTALSIGWHTFVITYDGSGGALAANGITMYVDGAVVASTATNNANYVAMENLAVPVWIGAIEGTGGTPANMMQGDFTGIGIDKGYVWTAKQIMQYHLAMKGLLNL